MYIFVYCMEITSLQPVLTFVLSASYFNACKFRLTWLDHSNVKPNKTMKSRSARLSVRYSLTLFLQSNQNQIIRSFSAPVSFISRNLFLCFKERCQILTQSNIQHWLSYSNTWAHWFRIKADLVNWLPSFNIWDAWSCSGRLVWLPNPGS